jgi:hypothetical protein
VLQIGKQEKPTPYQHSYVYQQGIEEVPAELVVPSQIFVSRYEEIQLQPKRDGKMIYGTVE